MDTVFFAVMLLGVILLFVDNIPQKITIKERLRSITYWGYIILIVSLLGLIFVYTYNYQTKIIRIIIEGQTPKLIEALSKFAWPVITLLAINKFLPKIANIIPYFTWKLESGPVSVTARPNYEAEPQDNIDKLAPDTSASPNMQHHMQIPTSYHQELINLLQRIPSIQNLDVGQKINWFMSAAVFEFVRAEFEKTYSTIFGSQILALNSMNLSNASIDPLPFYNIHLERVKTIPELQPSLEKWSNFLISQGLITSQYSITEKGKAFIKFIQDNHYEFNKPF